MKILIDIGHPAHVHYFKNFVKIMETKGHEFLITARDKEITFELLNNYNIRYINRGKGGRSIISKLFYIPWADWLIYRQAHKFKPDLFLSFSSTYAAHASNLYGKPHIAMDDTEHAKFELMLYPPFSETLLNPNCFSIDLGRKQIRFNSYMELCYLHPNYFKPNPTIYELLNISNNEKFAIIRFVSWNASHDVGQKGLTIAEKVNLVSSLSKRIRVFVSSERDMPVSLEKYQFKIPPKYMHDALSFAELYIGEGGTTASEAALLGVPAIYVNELKMGYIEDEKKAGLLYQITNYKNIINKVDEILSQENNDKYKQRSRKLLSDKIDITAFMVWFIENYPESTKIMKENPDYQYRFK